MKFIFMYTNSVHISQKTDCFSKTKTIWLTSSFE